MPSEFSRFEITRRGYDPKAVEKELNALNAELVRLREQLQESGDALGQTTAKLDSAVPLVVSILAIICALRFKSTMSGFLYIMRVVFDLFRRRDR